MKTGRGIGGLSMALGLALLSWLGLPPSHAQAGLPAAAANSGRAALQVQSLAAGCAACHGTAGQAVSDSAVPGLAGQPAAYLAEQMRAYKSGSRSATVMQQIAKGYSDAQIDQLSGYFAAQRTGPTK